MSYSVKLTPAAREYLKGILGYYKEVQDGLNTRFFKMLINAIRALGKAPFLFQVCYKNIRQAPIKKFPFWIHYLVDEQIPGEHIASRSETCDDPFL